MSLFVIEKEKKWVKGRVIRGYKGYSDFVR